MEPLGIHVRHGFGSHVIHEARAWPTRDGFGRGGWHALACDSPLRAEGMRLSFLGGYSLSWKNQIAWVALKEGENWKFNINSHHFRDMHHPIEGKASIIYLKRNGELRLRFQQPDSSWSEVVEYVGWPTSTRESFSHAAFGSNNGIHLSSSRYECV
jgi:hypothetical protein